MVLGQIIIITESQLREMSVDLDVDRLNTEGFMVRGSITCVRCFNVNILEPVYAVFCTLTLDVEYKPVIKKLSGINPNHL